jgi:hypothetical protein
VLCFGCYYGKVIQKALDSYVQGHLGICSPLGSVMAHNRSRAVPMVRFPSTPMCSCARPCGQRDGASVRRAAPAKSVVAPVSPAT